MTLVFRGTQNPRIRGNRGIHISKRSLGSRALHTRAGLTVSPHCLTVHCGLTSVIHEAVRVRPQNVDYGQSYRQ